MITRFRSTTLDYSSDHQEEWAGSLVLPALPHVPDVLNVRLRLGLRDRDLKGVVTFAEEETLRLERGPPAFRDLPWTSAAPAGTEGSRSRRPMESTLAAPTADQTPDSP